MIDQTCKIYSTNWNDEADNSDQAKENNMMDTYKIKVCHKVPTQVVINKDCTSSASIGPILIQFAYQFVELQLCLFQFYPIRRQLITLAKVNKQG